MVEIKNAAKESMKEFNVELKVYAKVKVNDEIVNNYQEQYGPIKHPFLEVIQRQVAQAILYAYINPLVSYDVEHDVYFDGVCNMNGLIRNIEVEIE